MSLKCPVPYASQPGNPLPYGLGLGDNIKMSSNKHVCVFCTIWPSDTYVVGLSCLDSLIWFEWCKLITQERLWCRSHVLWVPVRCSLHGSPGGSGCLGLWNLKRKLWGPTRWTGPSSEEHPSSARVSDPSGGRWRGECHRIPPVAPLIFILHQYFVIGRWWILTSVIQRRQSLIYVICIAAFKLFGGNSGHLSCQAPTRVRQYRHTQMVF